MRSVTLAALVAASCLAAPLSFAASSGEPSAGKPSKVLQTKKRARATTLPTWEQCYAMSRRKGFDHDYDEWMLSIQECMEGKIPL